MKDHLVYHTSPTQPLFQVYCTYAVPKCPGHGIPRWWQPFEHPCCWVGWLLELQASSDHWDPPQNILSPMDGPHPPAGSHLQPGWLKNRKVQCVILPTNSYKHINIHIVTDWCRVTFCHQSNLNPCLNIVIHNWNSWCYATGVFLKVIKDINVFFFPLKFRIWQLVRSY